MSFYKAVFSNVKKNLNHSNKSVIWRAKSDNTYWNTFSFPYSLAPVHMNKCHCSLQLPEEEEREGLTSAPWDPVMENVEIVQSCTRGGSD